MTTRPRRTTTLVGPNRLVLGAATGGLVALASAGTALLVLTGTSSVAPIAAPAPPLPTMAPPSHAPGVVVLPSDEAGRLTGTSTHQAHRGSQRPAVASVRLPAQLPTLSVLPVALPFTDVPVPPVADPVPPLANPVSPLADPVAPPLPALHRTTVPDEVDAAACKHHEKTAKAAHDKKAKKHPRHHGKKHVKKHGKKHAKHQHDD